MQLLRRRKTLPDQGDTYAVFGESNIEDDDRVAGTAGIDEKVARLYFAVGPFAVLVEGERSCVDKELLQPPPIARMIACAWRSRVPLNVHPARHEPLTIDPLCEG